MIINKEILADLQADDAIDDDAFIETVLNVLAGPSFEAMVAGLSATYKALETTEGQNGPREERHHRCS